ncbi:hypothetical protein BSL78_11174 [Apostichopus japonicus]|uniref:Uncharacterized protein n=1 Tax=Stichopus japonicus TaxID=307972 RepID=A0A2G8KVC3_STIJA|nr:hypothetical protein BSL78_11174 [Apostichopus japonicus]
MPLREIKEQFIRHLKGTYKHFTTMFRLFHTYMMHCQVRIAGRLSKVELNLSGTSEKRGKWEDSYDEYIGSEPTAEPQGDVLAILKEDILTHSEVILATRLPCNQEHFSTPKKTIRLTGFDKFKQNQYIHNDIKNTGLMEIIKESLLENPVIEGADNKVTAEKYATHTCHCIHYKITIPRLLLLESLQSVNISGNEIVLNSGLCLPIQNYLQELWIELDGVELNVTRFKSVLSYALNCQTLTTVAFSLILLPLRFDEKEILLQLQEKRLAVLWYPSLMRYSLNPRSGLWEHTTGQIALSPEELEREVKMFRELHQ